MRQIKNLNIYFSDKCNFNCAYCCMGTNHNRNDHIRAELKSGAFSKKVINIIQPQTESLGLWGMEPTVNADLFANFILPILSHAPQIKRIMFSTNGGTSGSMLYHYVVKPLLQYDISLYIQFSIDGPAEINDINRQKNSYRQALSCLNDLIRNCPLNISSTFKLFLSTKSTLTKINLSNNDPATWYAWAKDLHDNLLGKLKTRFYINIDKIGDKPTIELPGRYFGYDADKYHKWFGTIDISRETPRCAAGISSFTIDCDGKIWDCQMLKQKNGYDEKILRANFDKRVDQLLKNNQITQTNKNMLFNAIMSVWCWASASDINKIDDSYILLFGNL